MKDLPYKILHEELTNKSIVRFSGQLIINHIEKMTVQVKEKLSADKNMVIEIDNPESLDVTFIQLILSMKKTVEGKGKEVTINTDLREDLNTLIQNSGFIHVLN